MAALAFALSDSAVGVFDVDVVVLDGPWCEAHLCGAVLLPPDCTCVFARVGLMKTPALLVRSPSCARSKPTNTTAKASAATQADNNFSPPFTSGSPPSTDSHKRAALY